MSRSTFRMETCDGKVKIFGYRLVPWCLLETKDKNVAEKRLSGCKLSNDGPCIINKIKVSSRVVGSVLMATQCTNSSRLQHCSSQSCACNNDSS